MKGAGGGRPRKPTVLKVLEGTARPDRANPNEPKLPLFRIPPPPEGLPATESNAWSELGALVDELKIATKADLPAFALMAQAVAMCAEAREALRRDGLIIEETTKAGVMVRQRPEVTILASFQKIAMYHFNRWGLTPADRSRVSALADDAGEVDPLGEFSRPPARGGNAG